MYAHRLKEVRMGEQTMSLGIGEPVQTKHTVILALLLISLPLTNARTACVRQDDSTDILKNIGDFVPFHRSPNLF